MEKKIEVNRALNVGCSDITRWIPNTEGLDNIDHGQKWLCSVFDFKPPYLYDAVFAHHFVFCVCRLGRHDRASTFLTLHAVVEHDVEGFDRQDGSGEAND